PALLTLQKVKKDVVILRLQVREERMGPLLLIGMLHHSSSLVCQRPDSWMVDSDLYRSEPTQIRQFSTQYTRSHAGASSRKVKILWRWRDCKPRAESSILRIEEKS